MTGPEKEKAPRNRTIQLTEAEAALLRQELFFPDHRGLAQTVEMLDRIICADLLDGIRLLPDHSADLLILDPPYNMTKTFAGNTFRSMEEDVYERWMESWFVPLLDKLKPQASIYVCGDWRSSTSIHRVLARHVHVWNRITWEREKGRSAARNWKNASEDIWFASVGKDYYFDAEAVRLKRKVIAPYRDADGSPKDWADGYRMTAPSNLLTDITVPFWSMPENTPHPTQKPEKLIAKLLLASSRPGDIVLDPFLGSGTTAAVARKLGRHFYGIEREEQYALLAQKRVQLAMGNQTIQGYEDGVFWERNSMPEMQSAGRAGSSGKNKKSRSADE